MVFDRTMFGPDAIASLTINETKQLVDGATAIYEALSKPIDKNNTTEFAPLKAIFEKSLAVNKNLPQGHILTFEDLESKKPKGFGIAVQDYATVIGKKLIKDKMQWDFLNEADLQ